MKTQGSFWLILISLFALWSCDEDGTGTRDDATLLLGIWQNQTEGKTTQGKEYLAGGGGYLGNFSSGDFARASTFEWNLDGYTLIETRESGAVSHLYIVLIDEERMELRRLEDGVTRPWLRMSPAPGTTVTDRDAP